MVVKGIVEEIVASNQVKVRIPYFDKIDTSRWATTTENLATAGIATFPNGNTNYQVGDIVIIGFNEGRGDQPLVLGQLQRETKTSSYPDLTLANLTTINDTILSDSTYIGNISPSEIKTLAGSSENIKFKLDLLEARISALEAKLSN